MYADEERYHQEVGLLVVVGTIPAGTITGTRERRMEGPLPDEGTFSGMGTNSSLGIRLRVTLEEASLAVMHVSGLYDLYRPGLQA